MVEKKELNRERKKNEKKMWIFIDDLYYFDAREVDRKKQKCIKRESKSSLSIIIRARTFLKQPFRILFFFNPLSTSSSDPFVLLFCVLVLLISKSKLSFSIFAVRS